MPAEVKRAVIDAIQIREYGVQALIFAAGDEAKAYYGLLSGEVRISSVTADGDEVNIAWLTGGYWFGEMPFLDQGLRTQNAHAVSKVTLACIPAADMHHLMEKHPAFYAAVVHQLCHHARLLYAAVNDFLLLSPQRLLARRLLDLLMIANDSRELNISQQELGRFIGVSRQSINRILCNWERKGVVKRRYRKLQIVDVEALKQIKRLSDR